MFEKGGEKSMYIEVGFKRDKRKIGFLNSDLELVEQKENLFLFVLFSENENIVHWYLKRLSGKRHLYLNRYF